MFKNEIAQHGTWKGVKLDTLEKAKGYIRYQYQHGLLVMAEVVSDIEAAELEFMNK